MFRLDDGDGVFADEDGNVGGFIVVADVFGTFTEDRVAPALVSARRTPIEHLTYLQFCNGCSCFLKMLEQNFCKTLHPSRFHALDGIHLLKEPPMWRNVHVY